MPNSNVEGVLSNECDRLSSGKLKSNLWLGNTIDNVEFFTINLNVLVNIIEVEIKNSKGGSANNKGTNVYAIDVAVCNSHWNQVVSDSLTSAIDLPCDQIPTQTVTIGQVGRYLKFTALSHYGVGSALQTFHVITADNAESSSDYNCPRKYSFEFIIRTWYFVKIFCVGVMFLNEFF